MIFLHAALTIKKYRIEGDSKIYKSVEPIFSELIELPISKMQADAKSLVVGTFGLRYK